MNAVPHQQNFRRVIVAKSILQMSEGGDQRKLALIYPPTHSEGIIKFLQNPTHLSAYFSAISPLKEIDAIKQSFFTDREYLRQGDKWIKVGETEIG